MCSSDLETLVNVRMEDDLLVVDRVSRRLMLRMEDDLLVVDRVSRRLMLRAGTAVVGVWNDAFDVDGVVPVDATTVPGVRRSLKNDGALPRQALSAGQPRSEVQP